MEVSEIVSDKVAVRKTLDKLQEIVVVPLAPISLNQYYTYITGKPSIKKKGHVWRTNFQKYLKDRKKVEGKVRLHLKFQFRDRRKHDLDNCLKATFDAMKDILFEDDDNIEELTVQREKGTGQDVTYILVESLEKSKEK
jgi:Holliday junction resolvase RusA-like endonuclease